MIARGEQDRFLATVERLPSLKAGELTDLTFTVDPKLLGNDIDARNLRLARHGSDCGPARRTAIDRETEMTDIKPAPKKSVALSGVIAGNTALCTVGRTGNDLHYRGYDILDVAETCEFEEIAYLLVHGSLPTLAELSTTRPS